MNLGRLISGVSTSLSSGAAYTTSGDHTTVTDVTMSNGVLTQSGVSLSAGSDFFNSSLTTSGNRTISGIVNSGTPGVVNGSFTINGTGEGLTGEGGYSVAVPFTYDVVAKRTFTAPATTDFGRMMVGTTVTPVGVAYTTSGDHNVTTDVTMSNTGQTDGNGATITAGSDSFTGSLTSGSRTLGGTFNTTGVNSSAFTINGTGEGLTGEGSYSVSVPYTATVVAQRTFTSPTTVNLGYVLQNGAKNVNTVVSYTTSGDHNHATDETVTNTALANADGVTLSAGSDTFNGVATSGARTLGGTFQATSTPGVVSNGFVLTSTGEGLVGETVQTINVNYTATVGIVPLGGPISADVAASGSLANLTSAVAAGGGALGTQAVILSGTSATAITLNEGSRIRTAYESAANGAA